MYLRDSDHISIMAYMYNKSMTSLPGFCWESDIFNVKKNAADIAILAVKNTRIPKGKAERKCEHSLNLCTLHSQNLP